MAITTAAITMALLAAPSAVAQKPPDQPSLLPPPTVPMSLAEYQGMSCAIVGAITGIGALAYLTPIEEATVGLSATMLLVPVVGTGFAVGCSVGATLAPVFLWIYRNSNWYTATR